MGVIEVIREFPTIVEENADVGGARFVLASLALALAVYVVLLLFLGQGRRWAWFGYLFVSVVASAYVVLTLTEVHARPVMSVVLSAAQWCFDVAAILLLLRRSAREWFCSLKKSAVNVAS
mgnify:CR=1 FL=1